MHVGLYQCVSAELCGEGAGGTRFAGPIMTYVVVLLQRFSGDRFLGMQSMKEKKNSIYPSIHYTVSTSLKPQPTLLRDGACFVEPNKLSHNLPTPSAKAGRQKRAQQTHP